MDKNNRDHKGQTVLVKVLLSWVNMDTPLPSGIGPSLSNCVHRLALTDAEWDVATANSLPGSGERIPFSRDRSAIPVCTKVGT